MWFEVLATHWSTCVWPPMPLLKTQVILDSSVQFFLDNSVFWTRVSFLLLLSPWRRIKADEPAGVTCSRGSPASGSLNIPAERRPSCPPPGDHLCDPAASRDQITTGIWAPLRHRRRRR